MGVTPAPTVDVLPDAPDRGQDEDVFVAAAKLYTGALPSQGQQIGAAGQSAAANAGYAEDRALVAEAAATAALAAASAAIGATHYADTSSTNYTPALATAHVIALDNAGDLFVNGDRVNLIRLSAPTTNASGPVSLANMAGKVMTLTPDVVNNVGGGPFNDWIVVLAALGSLAPSSAAADRAGASSAVAVTPLSQATAAAFVVLPFADPLIWDTNDGYNRKVTLTAGAHVNAPSNLKDGWVYTLDIKQNGAGGHVLTWDAIWDFRAAGPPTLSTGANKKDKVTAQYSADSGKLEAVFNKSA